MQKIIVGMSGGVDSAVSSLLMKQSGYDVTGATFILHDSAEAEIRDAKAVCRFLGIEHVILDFSSRFQEAVVAPFVRAYEAGRTPNPCVICNKHIKFGAFWENAAAMGFDKIATGHYAKSAYEDSTERFQLRKGACPRKDQSYVLYNLTQELLARIELPLGGLPKEEVRRIAKENGLPVHTRPDSQDICFIPDGNYAGFLERFRGAPMPSGLFIGEDGKELGSHKGICHYTIGQRRGLGISHDKPVFVTAIDASSNTVVIGGDEALWERELTARYVNWIEPPDAQEIKAEAKIRYAHGGAAAAVTLMEGDRVKVVFDEPQRAITPGQSVVFYNGDIVLGGGEIE